MMVLSHTFEEFAGMVKAFHGSVAPGIMIGGSMVDLAYRCLPEGGLYDVICETQKCLPDAAQLLTPCSIGNGWLRIMDTGRFSLAFYDKYTGEGIRVFIDPAKLDAWPEIRGWFLKLTPKKDQDSARLMKEIEEAGSDICSVERIQVSLDLVEKKKGGPITLCPSCGEPYPSGRGALCPACKGGMLPYGSGPRKGGRVDVC
ncbi:MAG: FmdE, Molybdenum formylmethanofuran dehydrogenase operon [Syntrophorhabdus sp. PtaB.Bin047]|nr:MAG: FmdE, Molybdenum formylmethanofuran dehydrogenase operon [Syntrophorhabdus sp. PtaB.Bin047]